MIDLILLAILWIGAGLFVAEFIYVGKGGGE